MWKNKKVSVIFSTYNEKESIRNSINDFFKIGFVDEIIVVNNNAVSGTKEEVEKTKAKQIFESKQGYGHGYQRALRECTGELIIMSEPDGTFCGKDVLKLLSYSDDFDVVFGTRTTNALILKDANMGLFLKWGNWFVAKLIEVLFSTTHLSDAGCTMKLLKRHTLKAIKPHTLSGGSHFGLELMLKIIILNLNFVEIPIHYKERVGQSSVTGSKWKAFKLGLIMIFYVLFYRIDYFFKIFRIKKRRK